jgi:hypothetical protein
MFRFITIASLQGLEEFDFVRLRIYDLFFLFPSLANEITFPRLKGVSEIKKKAVILQEPYENLPDKKRLFSEMGDYHIQALQILLSKDVFQESNGKLRLSDGYYSEPIKKLLSDNQYCDNDFFGGLIKILNQIDLAGDSGLKRRTGLMEYRYDAV